MPSRCQLSPALPVPAPLVPSRCRYPRCPPQSPSTQRSSRDRGHREDPGAAPAVRDPVTGRDTGATASSLPVLPGHPRSGHLPPPVPGSQKRGFQRLGSPFLDAPVPVPTVPVFLARVPVLAGGREPRSRDGLGGALVPSCWRPARAERDRGGPGTTGAEQTGVWRKGGHPTTGGAAGPTPTGAGFRVRIRVRIKVNGCPRAPNHWEVPPRVLCGSPPWGPPFPAVSPPRGRPARGETLAGPMETAAAAGGRPAPPGRGNRFGPGR